MCVISAQSWVQIVLKPRSTDRVTKIDSIPAHPLFCHFWFIIRETLDFFELMTFANVATKGFMFGSAAEFIREAENIYQRNKVMLPMLAYANGSRTNGNIGEMIQAFKRNIVSFHNK